MSASQQEEERMTNHTSERDLFAMAALTGLLAATRPEHILADQRLGINPAEMAVKAAYQFADAMMAERAKALSPSTSETEERG